MYSFYKTLTLCSIAHTMTMFYKFLSIIFSPALQQYANTVSTSQIFSHSKLSATFGQWNTTTEHQAVGSQN